jgi:hypothetical protein
MIKIRKQTQKTLPLYFKTILILFPILYACANRHLSVEKSFMNGTVVEFNLSGLLSDTTLINLHDSFKVYNDGEKYYYLFPVKVFLENDSVILSATIEYSIFEHTRDSLFGLYFNNQTKRFSRLSADSIFKRNAFGGFGYLSANDSLVQTKMNVDSFLMVETYVRKKVIDQSYADTTILYYNKLSLEPSFNLSKKLETEKGLNLVKVKMIFNAQYYPQFDIKFPYHEHFFLIRPSKLDKDSIGIWKNQK